MIAIASPRARSRCNFADRHGRETVATEYPMTSSNTHDPDGPGSSDDLTGLEILLVEDSLVVGEAMKDQLELLGADVVGPAATTTEAEHLLSEHAPDVALVDFHLRGGELSYSLIARLHEQGVPVILVSGSSESLSGLPVEVATILEKPFSEAQLLASLRPLLTQKEPR
jgi:DNA-binding response OmpR family regulator